MSIFTTWCMQQHGNSWKGLYAGLEINMAPRLEVITTVSKSVLENKPYVDMYMRERRNFDQVIQVPRSMLCSTSCEGDLHVMVTCIGSYKHTTFRLARKEFQTELCREAALPLSLTLWARVSTFCLHTTENIVMKLHEFLLAEDLRAQNEFLLAARAEHEFLLAAHDARTLLAWRNFSCNSGEDESEEDAEVIGAARSSSSSP